MEGLSNFEIVVAIIELVLVAIIGIAGIVIAVFSHRRSMLDAIWEWTRVDGSKEVIESRGFVQYELDANYDPVEIRKDKDTTIKIAPIINAYNHLGILLKQRYIPLSIFRDTSAGETIVIVYEKLLPYILNHRETHNSCWADGFEHLYSKVKKH